MRELRQLEQFAEKHRLLYLREAIEGGIEQVSIYSNDMKYRYAFARWWSSNGPIDLWLGANPGTGDTEERRRPMLERCITRSQASSASGLLIGNLFAARSKAAKELRAMSDPIGPHNDEAIRLLTQLVYRTIVAWGNWGRMSERAAQVAKLLNEPQCLGVTAAGQPRHPLYVSLDVRLVRWLG